MPTPVFAPYTINIPNGPNSPSADQPIMQQNTNSINSLIGVDHYGFNNNLGGLHQQVQMPKLNSIPLALIANEGTLYTKHPSAETQLFYTPDITGNEYQLTRTDTAKFAEFGTNTAYSANHTGGWTFLPGAAAAADGAMLMNYGKRTSLTSGTNTITFAKPFTDPVGPYSVTISPVNGTSNLTITAVSTTTFTVNSSQVNTTAIYFTAIGV